MTQGQGWNFDLKERKVRTVRGNWSIAVRRSQRAKFGIAIKPIMRQMIEDLGPMIPYENGITLLTMVRSKGSRGSCLGTSLLRMSPNIRNYVSTFSCLFIVFFVFKKPSPFTFKRHEGKVQKSRSKSTKDTRKTNSKRQSNDTFPDEQGETHSAYPSGRDRRERTKRSQIGAMNLGWL